MFGPPQYEHTQAGWLRWLMYGLVAVLSGVLYFNPSDPVLQILMPSMAAVFLLLSFTFGDLTVRDECEELVIEFGPLHLIRKRVPYAEILRVSTGRTTFLNGWGIHYTSGGWLWNLSGFDCVQLDLKGNRKLRIGTDEPAKLLDFLRSRVPPA
jgi:hypothetical protein